MRRNQLLPTMLALLLAATVVAPALAHQPFFEDEDLKAASPWEIKDPSISTALYATLDSPGDVDYFAFEGLEREVILLELTIPQIDGQKDFAPTLALMGPGLPQADLLDGVVVPEGAGVLIIEPPAGPPPAFFEPFSRTSYWERQEQRVTLPDGGRFTVAVWHPEGEVGRYTFVIGEKEEFGGDLAFPLKMREYWTPVEMPLGKPEQAPLPLPSCGG